MAQIMRMSNEYWTKEQVENAEEICEILEESRKPEKRKHSKWAWAYERLETTYAAAVIISMVLLGLALVYHVGRMNFLAAMAVEGEYGIGMSVLYIIPNIVLTAMLYTGTMVLILMLPRIWSWYAEKTRKQLKRCVYRNYSLRRVRRTLRWNVPGYLLLAFCRILAGKNYHRFWEEVANDDAI